MTSPASALLLLLLLRLALAVRRLGMFVGGLRMGVSLRRLLATLRVIPFAVMFRSHPVAPRGVVMVFRGLIVGVLGHASPLLLSCNALERLGAVIVPELGSTRGAQFFPTPPDRGPGG